MIRLFIHIGADLACSCYSVDQLTDENLARSQLSFLKGARPHEQGCIVVSALLDGGTSLYERV